MELEDLKYFRVLAEECHFGRAAARLHVSTAQVSYRLKKLERHIGGALMRRTTREAELTPLGRELLQGAKPLLGLAGTLERRVIDQAAGRSGTLRLGVNGSATFTVLPSIARIMRTQLPDANVLIHAQAYTIILEAAAVEGRVDLIVARTPLTSGELKHRTLFRDPMALAVPSGHRLARRRTARLADIHGEDLVSFPLGSGSAVAAMADNALRAEGVLPRRRAAAGDTTALLGMVAAGMGVAIMPRSVSAMQPPGLTFLHLPALPSAEMVAAWRSDNHDPLVHTVVRLMNPSDMWSSPEPSNASSGRAPR